MSVPSSFARAAVLAVMATASCSKTDSSPAPDARGEAKVDAPPVTATADPPAADPNACDEHTKNALVATLRAYCAVEPSLLDENVAASPDADPPVDLEASYGYFLSPEGIDDPYREHGAKPTPIDEYEPDRIHVGDGDPTEPLGIAITADTPATIIAGFLGRAKARGRTAARIAMSRPRSVPIPAPPDPAELARLREAENREDAYGPLLTCLDWVETTQSATVLHARDRCQMVEKYGIDAWVRCGCPGTRSVFEQHLHLVAVGLHPTERTRAYLDITFDESATIEVGPDTPWSEIVTKLPEARPAPFWLRVKGATRE